MNFMIILITHKILHLLIKKIVNIKNYNIIFYFS